MTILMANEVIPEGLPGSASYAGALIPAQSALLNGTIYEYTPFEVSDVSAILCSSLTFAVAIVRQLARPCISLRQDTLHGV